MSKRIVVIDGHPDPDEARYCHALAYAYERGATAAGHDVRILKLSAMDFPMLRSAQEFSSGAPPEQISAAQEAIRDAEHIVIVYPLWLGTMPALLKAFLEQVLRPGFGFATPSEGWPKQLLQGRSARIIVTMGMPSLVYRWYFGAHSLKSLERNILKFVGIKPIRETLIGMIEAMTDKQRKRWLSDIETLGKEAR